MATKPPEHARIKGRGTSSNREGRFEPVRFEAEDDGWSQSPDSAPRPATEVRVERARSIISRNHSPDIPFDQSINPYRGCEHGCVYCYARPSHAYLNLSPGLDFETRLFAKTNAIELLRRELARPGYRPAVINLGANTDPYQPIEREHRITRGLLELLLACRHPVTLITKNALIERDLDLLGALAREQLVQVFVSVATLDNRLASRLEPRATAPHRRIECLARLHQAGVPVGVFVAPIIPMLTDHDIESILQRCRQAGVSSASYTLLRLPHELSELFREWLSVHQPARAAHIMSLIRQMRGGHDNDSRFATRMRGEGVFAELIRQRFELACRRLGIDRRNEQVVLSCADFRRPMVDSPQAELF